MGDDLGGSLVTEALGADGGQDGGAGQNTTDSGQPGAKENSTLLSSLASDKTDNQQGEAKPGVPETPDGYTLEFSEATQVDSDLLNGFQNTAHELGLNNDQAQKLAKLYEAHAGKQAERAEKAQIDALLQARTRWEAEIRQSATFEQDKALVMSVLRQFGSRQLYDLFDQTNLGSHPEFFKFLTNVGKAMAEPDFKGSNDQSREKSAAETLYPNMARAQ